MSNQADEYIPDWMRCIICKVVARNGRIEHSRNCAEYRPPVRRQQPKKK